jgi:hypothetical protein
MKRSVTLENKKGDRIFTTSPFLKTRYEGKNDAICPTGKLRLLA